MMQYTILHVNAKMISQLDFYTTNVMKAVVQRIRASTSQLEIELKFETSRGNNKFKVRSTERMGRRKIQKTVFIEKKNRLQLLNNLCFRNACLVQLSANEPEIICTEGGHTVA